MITVTFEAGNTNVRIVRIVTDSTFAQVTTAGWYANTAPNQLNPSDQVEINYSDGAGGTLTSIFTVSITAGVVTLSVAESSVVLPTTAGLIAHFVNSSGTIGDAPGTVNNLGNIVAGGTVTQGKFISLSGNPLGEVLQLLPLPLLVILVQC